MLLYTPTQAAISNAASSLHHRSRSPKSATATIAKQKNTPLAKATTCHRACELSDRGKRRGQRARGAPGEEGRAALRAEGKGSAKDKQAAVEMGVKERGWCASSSKDVWSQISQPRMVYSYACPLDVRDVVNAPRTTSVSCPPQSYSLLRATPHPSPLSPAVVGGFMYQRSSEPYVVVFLCRQN